MAVKVGQLTVDLLLNTAKFEKEINKTVLQFNKVGKNLSRAGKNLTAGITLPLVTAGSAAVKFATDFNKGMANVATLIPGNLARVKELKKGVQDLAIATAKSTTDMSDGLYQVISAFGDTGDTMKILETNAKAATAGLASTTDAINLTSAVTKGYGDVSAEAVKKAADLAFVTVKLGQTTFPELAASIGRVVPVAATLGVKQEELFAGFAALTGVTGNASEVSTQLAAILRAMIKPTEDMSAAVESLGFNSAQTMVQQLGMSGALKALVGTTDGTTESVAKLFGRAEALNAVFAITGAQAGDFNSKLEAMAGAAGSMGEAFKEQTDGINKAGFSLEQFKTRLVVAGQRFGDALLPALESGISVFEKVVEMLAKLADFFAALPEPIQLSAVGMLAFVAAIGPVTWAIGSMYTSMGNLLRVVPLVGGGVGKLIKVVSGAGGLTGSLGGVVAMLTGPVGITVAIGAAIAGLAVFASKNDEIKDAMIEAWTSIKESVSELWGGLKAAAKTITDAIASVWEEHGETIKAIVDFLWTNVIGLIKSALTIISGIISGTLKAISGIFNVFAGIFTFNWKTFTKGLGQIWDGIWTAIKGIGKGALDYLVRMINWAIDKLNKLPGINLPKIVLEVDTEPMEEALDRLNSGTYDAKELPAVFDAIGSAADGVVPSLAAAGSAAADLGDKAAPAADKLGKVVFSAKDLREEFEKMARPAEEIAKKMASLEDAGISLDRIVSQYGEDLVDARRKEIEHGEQLGEMTGKYLDLAWQVKLTREGMGDLAMTMESRLTSAMDQVQREIQETYDEIGKLKPRADLLNESFYDIGLTVGEYPEIFGLSEEAVKDFSKTGREETTKLGNQVSTTLTNMTQKIADSCTEWAGSFQSFASAALSALLEGLFNPFIDMLTSLGNKISSWLTGLAGKLFGFGGGGGFGWGDLFGSFGSKAIGSAVGIGGSAAAPSVFGAIAEAGAGVTGLGGGAAGGGAAAAGGGGGFLSSMGAFLTNPWTIGIAAAGALGYGLYKWISGKNAYEAGSPEVMRDFGMEIGEGGIKAFFDSLGLSESQAYHIRKDLLSSPIFQASAIAAGLTPMVSKYGNLEAFGKSFDFRSSIMQGMAGYWDAYNRQYAQVFSQSERLKEILPNWMSTLLVPNAQPAPADVMKQIQDQIGGGTGMLDTLRMVAQPLAGSPEMIDYLWSPRRSPNARMMDAGRGIPAFASGIEAVPFDMLAWLHRGERVVPKSDNRSYHGGTFEVHFHINTMSTNIEEFIMLVRERVIPILKREMVGGPTGLRDVIRFAVGRTERAY